MTRFLLQSVMIIFLSGCLGCGVNRSVYESKLLFADAGDPDAQYDVGLSWFVGIQELGRDYQRARNWFLLSADQGGIHSQKFLRSHQSQMPMEKVELDTILQKSGQRDVDARYRLGWMYWWGYGFPQDCLKATTILGDLAEEGDSRAQYSLGILYTKGQCDLPASYAKAAAWHQKAASDGYAEAMFQLAMLYDYGGADFPEDNSLAVKWYTRSAEAGIEGAQHNLAVMYFKGEGVAKDPKQAYTWLKVVQPDILIGYSDEIISPRFVREEVESELTQQELEEAVSNAAVLANRIKAEKLNRARRH